MKIESRPKKRYTIEDYETEQPDNHGVFFYGKRIIEYQKEKGIKSYQFRLLLRDQSAYYKRFRESLSSLKNVEDLNYGFDVSANEPINFIATLVLADYQYAEPDGYIEIDYDKVIKKFAKTEYDFALERLKRRINGIVPDVVTYTGEYCKGDEFLEFTKESADCWAGPFEMNGKVGCVFDKRIENYEGEGYQELAKYTIDPSVLWTWYDLPHYLHKIHTSNSVYEMTPEEKKKCFMTFPIELQSKLIHTITKKYSSDDYIGWHMPYHVHLSGNDDCSYTKYFTSKEDVESELKYLRMMQPLDFNRDITKRGYVFTN